MNRYFKKKRIAAILFFLVIIFISVTTLRYGYSLIKSDFLQSTQIVVKDDSFFEKIEKIKINNQGIDNAVHENIYGKNIFIEIYGGIQKLMLKKESRNFEYIKDNDGYIHSGAFYIENDKDLFDYSKRLRRLKEAASKNGSKFLFVTYPEKSWIIKNYNKGLPIREYDYIQDEILTYAMNNRVDSLDLRTALKKLDIDQSKLYYKTDRTMTTYGSFMVFKALVLEINKRYGENLDPKQTYTDIKNYDIEIYPDSFFGYMASKTGKNFSGTDDFEIYYSKTNEQYIWEYTDAKDVNYIKKGNTNILINKSYINQKNIYQRTALKTFLEGNNKMDKIVNFKNANAPKILCLKDDKFSPIAVFMAPVCSEVHLINILTSKMDIEKYIKENNFDYILLEISAEHINSSYFKFFKKNHKEG